MICTITSSPGSSIRSYNNPFPHPTRTNPARQVFIHVLIIIVYRAFQRASCLILMLVSGFIEGHTGCAEVEDDAEIYIELETEAEC